MGRRDENANLKRSTASLQAEGTRRRDYPFLPLSLAESFDEGNPMVRDVLGAPGRRTAAARIPFLVAGVVSAALGVGWIAGLDAWIRGGGSAILVEVGLATVGIVAAMSLLVAPLAGGLSRRLLERSAVLPELLLTRVEDREFLAPLRGLASLWTAASYGPAMVAWIVSTFAATASAWGKPPAVWGLAALMGLACGAASAANYVGGFHLRFAAVSLASAGAGYAFGSSVSLAAASFCARAGLFAILWRAVGVGAFAAAAVLEGWLAARRLQAAEHAWARAEVDFRRRLGDAVAERHRD